MRHILDSRGGLNSIYPPAEGLTFHPWLYMVPQYRPDDVLMLGYAGGTVAGLIRLFYGHSVPIVGVDVAECEDYYGVQLVRADARDYVKTARKHDAVVVDVFEDGSGDPCEFITDPQFVGNVRAICRYLIVHATEATDMDVYGDPLKVLTLNRSRFHYYVVERVPQLVIR